MPEGGRGKLSESREIAERIWIKVPQCGQSPDAGTVCPLPKSKKAKVLAAFFRRGRQRRSSHSNNSSLRGRSALRLLCVGPEQNRTSSHDRAYDHRSRGGIARIRARRTWLACVGPY